MNEAGVSAYTGFFVTKFRVDSSMLGVVTYPHFNSRFISYICPLHKPDVVPVFKYILFCISYRIYTIQYCRMDLSKNTEITFDYT